MGMLTAEQAVEVLQNAGLRAGRGYPGGVMPQVEELAVAVNVERAEAAEITLVARVCCPGAMGGEACETAAEQVAEAWTEAGGACRREGCTYDGHSDLFTVRVLGTWTTPIPVIPEPTMRARVSINGYFLEYATAVKVENTAKWEEGRGFMGEDHASFLKDQGWTVTVEELLPSREVSRDAANSFELIVSEGNQSERFSDCVWLSLRREDTASGIRQVRVCYTQTRVVEPWVS